MPRDEAKAQVRDIQRFDDRDMVACTLESSRRYLAAHPKSWFILYYHASSLHRMARYTESLAALRRAARLCAPTHLCLIYSRVGKIHDDRGALGLAERWYRRAIAQSPSKAGNYIFLGAFLARTGRLQEAEAVHRRATRCKKGCIDEAFLNLGLVLRALERYSDARKCFQRALEIDPKYKEARDALSDVEQVIELNHKA